MPPIWKNVLFSTVAALNAVAGVPAILAILVPSPVPEPSWLDAITYRSGAIFYLASCAGTCATMLARPSRGRFAIASVALIVHFVMVVTGLSTIVKEGRAFFSWDHNFQVSVYSMETGLVRKITPLENLSGPLVSLQVSGLREFTRFTDKDRKKRRGHRFHVGMRFASAYRAFILNARWHRKKELLDRSPERELKWLVKYRRGEEEKVGAIIGAPPGFPFHNRVIIISPEMPAPAPAEPHYLLLGGFDPEPAYHDPTAPYGYLLAAYPRDVMADLPPELPTHDYPDPTDVEIIGRAEA